MLSENAKLVIGFIEECRNQLMMKDELHEKQEKMYEALYEIEDILKENEKGKKVFVELESLLSETLSLTKEAYFEYGENYSEACDNQVYRKYKEAV